MIIKFMNHGSSVAVVRKDGAVLLQHRDDKPGIAYRNFWAFPGGGVEDENFEEAARRELKEETGYIADKLEILVEEEMLNEEGKITTRHVYWTKYDGLQKLVCFEGQELKFMLPEEFTKLNLIPGHKELALKALSLMREDQP